MRELRCVAFFFPERSYVSSSVQETRLQKCKGERKSAYDTISELQFSGIH